MNNYIILSDEEKVNVPMRIAESLRKSVAEMLFSKEDRSSELIKSKIESAVDCICAICRKKNVSNSKPQVNICITVLLLNNL